ncbi:hypothetical protein L1987_05571 [Smallanthus sonchifolius]|uniref:Uncharacterized protein n=1 Tax=Smallanthus sonchifolius TaxID=185202 RepID=A0ACB9JVT9_9ASTR|nr:hypothetical protein L1987_05571 [Smallanthus sonchifolius]
MNDTPPQPLEAAAAASTPATINPNNQTNSTYSTPNVSSDYEKCREQRIKENLERMQKLGIYDLSLKLKSVKPNSYRKNNRPLSTNQNKTPNCSVPPLPSSVPTRRSSRLQSTPAVSYSEVDLPKKCKGGGDELLIEKTSRPEVYTEEHEKLLGECKTEWTLFVDGYGKDGKRIYDQVRGKTCHQCRQKTLGRRTHCIKCNLVQGQFCGDCLYMRYGENVLEAMQNPDWICPVCRGICNCSLCRQAKGWAPTGMLYRKISSQGYKSVAHYLIQTYRSEKNEKTDTQVCAKRSLPFSREESESEDIAAKDENIESTHKNPEAEVNTDENPTELHSSDERICNNAKLESDQGLKENNTEAEVNEGENENKNKVNESEVRLELTNVECEVNNTVDDVKTVIVTPETKPGSRKKRGIVVLEDSIGARLRSRRTCA